MKMGIEHCLSMHDHSAQCSPASYNSEVPHLWPLMPHPRNARIHLPRISRRNIPAFFAKNTEPAIAEFVFKCFDPTAVGVTSEDGRSQPGRDGGVLGLGR